MSGDRADLLQHLRRNLLWILLGLVAANALFAIIGILLGNVGEFTLKALGTSLDIVVLSLLALYTTKWLNESYGWAIVAPQLGLVALHFVTFLAIVWGEADGEAWWKITLASLFMAIGVGLATFHWSRDGVGTPLTVSRWTGATAALLLAALLCAALLFDIEPDEGFWRGIAALGVLVAATIISTLVTAKLAKA